MKSPWKVVIGILIGLSLIFGAAAAVTASTHVVAATAIEYG
jgi:hypothetical protein